MVHRCDGVRKRRSADGFGRPDLDISREHVGRHLPHKPQPPRGFSYLEHLFAKPRNAKFYERYGILPVAMDPFTLPGSEEGRLRSLLVSKSQPAPKCILSKHSGKTR